MTSLADQIETAFDLSYLEFPKYPAGEIKSVGILGGGTAGYLAALALKKLHPEMQTSLIESSKIPVIGVGESTTTEIVPFLHRTLGIDPAVFFREVEPTLKLGIRFDWGTPGDTFNFNFFAGHQHESYYYEKSIQNANWASVLMNEHKLPVVRDEEGGLASLLGSIPFSYHLDNKKLLRFLRKLLDQRGIPVLDTQVTDVILTNTGAVDHLLSEDGQKLQFNLYVDCSGFRSRILGQALGTKFLPYKDTLINDRALTFERPNDGIVAVTTRCRTMDNGWCWTIPMRGENHHGYVHSSLYCDEATAVAEARAKYGPFEKYKMVEFRSGRHEKAFVKNVFSLGNAYGFVEPLESTAIQTAVHSIMTLCKLLPKNLTDATSIAGINHEIAASWDTFRWFLGIHYKFNRHLDTPYWIRCREQTDIGDAKMVVDLFRTRAPLSASHFGTNSPFTALEALVFNSNSYDTLLYGQKILENPSKPQMSEEEYRSRTKSYEQLTERALTQAELFAGDHLFADSLLEDLFSETDTWIVETEA